MIGLYIGRFQPFHKGHLWVIKNALKKVDQLIIGIGSAQYSNTKENILSSDERFEIIDETLKEEKIKRYKIIKIDDIHNYPIWVSHVEKSCDFNIVFVGNDINKQLFEEKNYKCIVHERYKKISGTLIRQKIMNHDKWKDLVSKKTYDLLVKFDFEKRVLSI
jgi:nicotinamide-nucleotide adenylyltransferase